MRVLICDDELDVAQIVAELLRREDIEAVVCGSGPEALAMLDRARFDLVVLDIMMPGMDGYEVCRRIRRSSDIPVLFLSAKTEELDQVMGFAIGADDYVTKPFKARELVARIKARIRRDRRASSHAVRHELLCSAGLELDTTAHEVTLNGEPVALTPTEFDLLAELMRAGESPVPASDLYERVWHEAYNASSRNSVMVYIRHLRKKLADIDSSRPFIDTVWGVGYRMRQAATCEEVSDE